MSLLSYNSLQSFHNATARIPGIKGTMKKLFVNKNSLKNRPRYVRLGLLTSCIQANNSLFLYNCHEKWLKTWKQCQNSEKFQTFLQWCSTARKYDKRVTKHSMCLRVDCALCTHNTRNQRRQQSTHWFSLKCHWLFKISHSFYWFFQIV